MRAETVSMIRRILDIQDHPAEILDPFLSYFYNKDPIAASSAPTLDRHSVLVATAMAIRKQLKDVRDKKSKRYNTRYLA